MAVTLDVVPSNKLAACKELVWVTSVLIDKGRMSGMAKNPSPTPNVKLLTVSAEIMLVTVLKLSK